MYYPRPLIAKIQAKEHFYSETYIEADLGKVTVIKTDGVVAGTIISLILTGKLSVVDYKAEINLPKKFLYKYTALIDAPDVSSPEPNMALSGVISEELAYSGQKSGFKAIRKVLEEFGALEYKSTKFDEIPSELRFRILVELASQRAEFLVWVQPDLHEANPDVYLQIAQKYAKKGFGVILLVRDGVL